MLFTMAVCNINLTIPAILNSKSTMAMVNAKKVNACSGIFFLP